MPPLTWRNVDAPSFSGVNDALRLASQSFNSGFDTIGKSLSDFQDSRTITDSNKLMLDVMKYQDPEAYKAALASGTVQSQVDPRNLNADSLKFVSGYQDQLIGTQQAGADLTGTNLNNSAKSFNNSQARSAASRAEAQRAALPAANQLAAQIRALAETGDPAKLIEARKLQVDNANIFTAAGMDPLGIMQGNTNAFSEGIGLNQSVANNQDFFEKRGDDATSENIVEELIRTTANADEAIKIAKNSNLPTDVLRSVLSDIESNQGSYFNTGSQNSIDRLMNGASTGGSSAPTSNVNAALNQSTANIPATSQGASVSVDEATNLTSAASRSAGPSNTIENNSAAKIIENTATIDRAFNASQAVDSYMQDRTNANETVAQTVSRLRKDELATVPEGALTSAINEIIEKYDVPADVAGIIASQSVEARDMRGWQNHIPIVGGILPRNNDIYGKATQGETAPRINMDMAGTIVKAYKETKGNDISSGVGRLNQNQKSKAIPQKLQELQSVEAEIDARYLQEMEAVKNNPRLNAEYYTNRYNQQKAFIKLELDKINNSGTATAYSSGVLQR